jgi:hypothetical protein
VLTSVVKWSEVVNNRVSIIVRRYVNHVMLAVYKAFSLITVFYIL